MSERTSLNDLIKKVKSHPKINDAGMILCHNGIVRATQRSGARPVVGVSSIADPEKLAEIQAWGESLPGIVTVAIEAFSGEFKVGDDLMYVVVAGDIREHVFEAMQAIVNRIKSEAIQKTERFPQ